MDIAVNIPIIGMIAKKKIKIKASADIPSLSLYFCAQLLLEVQRKTMASRKETKPGTPAQQKSSKKSLTTVPSKIHVY